MCVIPIFLAAAAAFGASPADPAAVAVQGPVAGTEDPRALDRKRVLEFAEGGLLRARTRFHDGRWERRDGRDWVPIEGVVVGHTLESDLLSRARAMAMEVKKDDHTARAVLADWMLRRGLEREGLSELDRILGDAPDHAGALKVLREHDMAWSTLLPDGDPSDWTAVAIAGAQGSAALREALVWKLARVRANFDVEAFLAKELVSPQFRRREFAVHAARRLARGPFRKELTDRAVLDTMGGVRLGAALALRDFQDAEVVSPVVDALGSRFSAVRKNAIEALGHAGYTAAIAPLMAHLAHLRSSGGGPSGVRANLFAGFHTAYVADYDVELAQGASIARPVVASQVSGVVFDVRAQAQLSTVVTVYVEARAVTRALTQLTGERELGDDVDRWLAWWRSQPR